MPMLLRWALRLVPVALLIVATSANADLTGHWHVETPGADPLTEIVQTGTSVTFTLTFSGSPLVFDGTVSGDTLSASSDDGPCPVGVGLRILPGETTMDGIAGAYGGPCTYPTKSRAFMSRCECHDGNQTNGDGCDAECQIEPCFVCSGEPSICTAAGDGAACNDRRDCTTGETCSSGVCGGGSAVVPCVDLTGRWFRTQDSTFGVFQSTSDILQRNGILVFRQAGASTLGYVGTIDASTGAMDLEIPSTALICTDPVILTASAAPDGGTYSGTGTATVESPHFICFGDSFTETGSRCGGGTLDPGETCDDGNVASGDGCSSTCQVEACFDCSGEPSTCTPQPSATPCNDGDPCTLNDACNGSGTCGGTPIDCAPCTICDGAGGCIEAPRLDCLTSLDPSKSKLQITDKTPDTKDALRWQWRAGMSPTSAQLGNPLASSSVATCLYDESTPTPTLLFRALVPPGGTCGTEACWKSVGQGGFRYNDKSGADGIVDLSLRPGANGKAKVDVKGKGSGLSGRPFGLPSPPLALPLRMQVQVEGAGCFEVGHGAAGVSKNVPGLFKGRGTP